MSKRDQPFFVGYLPVPIGLQRYLMAVALAFIAGLAIAGFLIGTTQDDPGKAGFRFDYGTQTLSGVVELTPYYPLLRVTKGNDRIAAGHTLMLTAQGKAGVMGRAAPLEGQLVTVTGGILQRGALDMMQLRGGKRGMKAIEGFAPALSVEPLGTWRLAGEICDGKCLAGAMRPGRGLAHKACANLCLVGDLPPVFVSSQPVEGSEFLMITGPDGSALPSSVYDFVAQFVSLEGDVSRHGDLLVLEVDPESIEVLE